MMELQAQQHGGAITAIRFSKATNVCRAASPTAVTSCHDRLDTQSPSCSSVTSSCSYGSNQPSQSAKSLQVPSFLEGKSDNSKAKKQIQFYPGDVVGEVLRPASFFDGVARDQLWWTRADIQTFKRKEKSEQGYLRFHRQDDPDNDSLGDFEERAWFALEDNNEVNIEDEKKGKCVMSRQLSPAQLDLARVEQVGSTSQGVSKNLKKPQDTRNMPRLSSRQPVVQQQGALIQQVSMPQGSVHPVVSLPFEDCQSTALKQALENYAVLQNMVARIVNEGTTDLLKSAKVTSAAESVSSRSSKLLVLQGSRSSDLSSSLGYTSAVVASNKHPLPKPHSCIPGPSEQKQSVVPPSSVVKTHLSSQLDPLPFDRSYLEEGYRRSSSPAKPRNKLNSQLDRTPVHRSPSVERCRPNGKTNLNSKLSQVHPSHPVQERKPSSVGVVQPPLSIGCSDDCHPTMTTSTDHTTKVMPITLMGLSNPPFMINNPQPNRNLSMNPLDPKLWRQRRSDLIPCRKSARSANRNHRSSTRHVKWVQGDVTYTVASPVDLHQHMSTHKDDLWWSDMVISARKLMDAEAARKDALARDFQHETKQVYSHLLKIIQQMKQDRNQASRSTSSGNFTLQHLLTPTILKGLAAGYRGMELGGMDQRYERSRMIVGMIVNYHKTYDGVGRNESLCQTTKASLPLAVIAARMSEVDRIWAQAMALGDERTGRKPVD